MDNIKYSRAMETLDDDHDLFVKFIGTLSNDVLQTASFTLDEYMYFYNKLKSKNDFTDEQLDYIINNHIPIVCTIVVSWKYVCEESKKQVDRDEFLQKWFTEMI
jgi:hypothetical protein